MSEIIGDTETILKDNQNTKVRKIIKRRPPFEQYHPCLHRFFKNGLQPIDSKPTKFIQKPPPPGLNTYAKPLCRRLLTAWINFGHILKDIPKRNIIDKLLDCGYTQIELDALLEAERIKREIARKLAEAGPFDVFDKFGNLLNPGGKLIKPKPSKPKVKKTPPKKQPSQSKFKKLNKNKGKGLKIKGSQKNQGRKKGKASKKIADQKGFESFKAGKSGQLRTGWPHFIGIQLMLSVWNLSSNTPDEEFLSRAGPYFDVQATIVCSMMRQALGLDPENLELRTPQDARIAIACLNLVVSIARDIVNPARDISDVDVQQLLDLHGEEPRLKVKPGPKKKQKGKVHESASDQGDLQSDVILFDELFEAPEDINFREDEDEQDFFNKNKKWYSPSLPEFIFDEKTNVSPSNEGILYSQTENGQWLWKFEELDDMTPQPVVPNEIPPYFPELRPRNSNKNDSWFLPAAKVQGELSPSAIVEIFEMISDTLMEMITIPTLSLTRLMEQVSEICTAISLATENEPTNLENEMLDDKRTIILEKMFIKLVGSNFRDYNEMTGSYMRILCQGAAKFIRHLYHKTSQKLWILQQCPVLEPDPETASPSEPDEVLYSCRDLIISMSDGCQEAKEWLEWLMASMQDEKTFTDFSEVIEDVENWIQWGKIRQKTLRDIAMSEEKPEEKLVSENNS